MYVRTYTYRRIYYETKDVVRKYKLDSIYSCSLVSTTLMYQVSPLGIMYSRHFYALFLSLCIVASKRP